MPSIADNPVSKDAVVGQIPKGEDEKTEGDNVGGKGEKLKKTVSTQHTAKMQDGRTKKKQERAENPELVDKVKRQKAGKKKAKSLVISNESDATNINKLTAAGWTYTVRQNIPIDIFVHKKSQKRSMFCDLTSKAQKEAKRLAEKLMKTDGAVAEEEGDDQNGDKRMDKPDGDKLDEYTGIDSKLDWSLVREELMNNVSLIVELENTTIEEWVHKEGELKFSRRDHFYKFFAFDPATVTNPATLSSSSEMDIDVNASSSSKMNDVFGGMTSSMITSNPVSFSTDPLVPPAGSLPALFTDFGSSTQPAVFTGSTLISNSLATDNYGIDVTKTEEGSEGIEEELEKIAEAGFVSSTSDIITDKKVEKQEKEVEKPEKEVEKEKESLEVEKPAEKSAEPATKSMKKKGKGKGKRAAEKKESPENPHAKKEDEAATKGTILDTSNDHPASSKDIPAPRKSNTTKKSSAKNNEKASSKKDAAAQKDFAKNDNRAQDEELAKTPSSKDSKEEGEEAGKEKEFVPLPDNIPSAFDVMNIEKPGTKKRRTMPKIESKDKKDSKPFDAVDVGNGPDAEKHLNAADAENAAAAGKGDDDTVTEVDLPGTPPPSGKRLSPSRKLEPAAPINFASVLAPGEKFEVGKNASNSKKEGLKRNNSIIENEDSVPLHLAFTQHEPGSNVGPLRKKRKADGFPNCDDFSRIIPRRFTEKDNINEISREHQSQDGNRNKSDVFSTQDDNGFVTQDDNGARSSNEKNGIQSMIGDTDSSRGSMPRSVDAQAANSSATNSLSTQVLQITNGVVPSSTQVQLTATSSSTAPPFFYPAAVPWWFPEEYKEVLAVLSRPCKPGHPATPLVFSMGKSSYTFTEADFMGSASTTQTGNSPRNGVSNAVDSPAAAGVASTTTVTTISTATSPTVPSKVPTFEVRLTRNPRGWELKLQVKSESPMGSIVVNKHGKRSKCIPWVEYSLSEGSQIELEISAAVVDAIWGTDLTDNITSPTKDMKKTKGKRSSSKKGKKSSEAVTAPTIVEPLFSVSYKALLVRVEVDELHSFVHKITSKYVFGSSLWNLAYEVWEARRNSRNNSELVEQLIGFGNWTDMDWSVLKMDMWENIVIKLFGSLEGANIRL